MDAEAHPLAGKTTKTIAIMLLALAVPYVSPRLSALQVVTPPWATDADDSSPGPDEAPVVAALDERQGELALGATENRATITNALPEVKAKTPPPKPDKKESSAVRVEDPTGHALDAFYKSLLRTKKKEKGAITRILHYGDSVISADYVSGTLRRRFQKTFGDAGHGFILGANAWPFYFHNDVERQASEGWRTHRITGPFPPDGMFGPGGASFHSFGGADIVVGTAKKGSHGRNVSRFDVYYLQQPEGGEFQVDLAGKRVESFSTRGEPKAIKIHRVKVPDGEAKMRLRAGGKGDVRFFGVALERDVPGVVYDALGANGARARLWDRMDRDHWKNTMKLRNPALIIVQYGTNESQAQHVNADSYQKALGDLIDKLRYAAPMASIVVASPLDRGERGPGGKIVTRKIIPQIVALQRKTALAHKVGFFNTFEAMGGEGTIGRWVHKKPPLASWDFTHPTLQGADVLGGLIYDALLADFDAYAKRPPTKKK